MRFVYAILASLVFSFALHNECNATQKTIGDYIALSKVVRTVWDDSRVPKTNTYIFEYAGQELRTTVSVRENNKFERVADAFFNADRTLSFVRKGAGGNEAETTHFVYDANGNLIEIRVSRDGKPVEKLEYEYDESNFSRRDIKRSEWSDGKWQPWAGSSMSLYVNVDGLPTAYEDIESVGKRVVVFEYGLNGAVLDSYTDTFKGQDGNDSDTFAFVSYGEQRPTQFSVRSNDSPDEELRITGQWQKAKLTGPYKLMREVVELCSDKGCRKKEERTFEYTLLSNEPLMPPPSMVLPFLGLGSSLCFIEKPEILLGKDGIGLPSWLTKYDKS